MLGSHASATGTNGYQQLVGNLYPGRDSASGSPDPVTPV